MMLHRSAYLLTVLISNSAFADVVVIDFEGMKPGESVNQFYNGGTGSDGSRSKHNYGILFQSAIVNTRGFGSNAVNQPSGRSEIVFLGQSRAAIMNVPKGFQNGFSFYYTSQKAGYVSVYSGLNGTGTLLKKIHLAPQPANGRTCAMTYNVGYCKWTPIGVKFSGTARSVSFGGSANRIGFDNITLGLDKPLSGSTRSIASAKPTKPKPQAETKPKTEPKSKQEKKPAPKPEIDSEMGMDAVPTAPKPLPAPPKQPEAPTPPPSMPTFPRPELEI